MIYIIYKWTLKNICLSWLLCNSFWLFKFFRLCSYNIHIFMLKFKALSLEKLWCLNQFYCSKIFLLIHNFQFKQYFTLKRFEIMRYFFLGPWLLNSQNRWKWHGFSIILRKLWRNHLFSLAIIKVSILWKFIIWTMLY